MKHSFLAALFLGGLAVSAHASVVAWWRFEDSDFLADSSGNGHTLTNGSGGTAASQITLPGTGAGSLFSDPVAGLPNGSAASFSGGQILSAADSAAFTSNTFTIEAFINLTSTGATRAIAGHLEGGTTNRSYLLALNSTGVMQMNYGTSTAVSNITIATGTDYFVALTVDMSDTSASGITFYAKNLSTGEEFMSSVAHTGTTLVNSTAPFTIGSTATPSSPYNGLIDEVRLSNTKLAAADLLVPLTIPEPSVVGLLALGAGLFFRRRR